MGEESPHMDLDKVLTNERVKEVVQYLKDLFIEFEQSYKIPHVTINIATATHIAESYLIDIERYDYYHKLNDSFDIYKHAAYLAKWIARHRPVYLTVDDADRLEDDNYFVNPVFAVYVGCISANISLVNADKNLLWLIAYSLEYRSNLDALTLLPQFMMLNTLYPDHDNV